MEDNELTKSIKKTIKSMIIISYVQVALLLPLLLLHVSFILIVLFNAPLIYYCRQLRTDLDELYDRADKHWIYIAEDAFYELMTHRNPIYFISWAMAFVAIAAFGYAIHFHGIFLYLLISIALYITLVLLCKTLTPELIMKSLDKPEEKHKPEDFEIKPPLERPLKK